MFFDNVETMFDQIEYTITYFDVPKSKPKKKKVYPKKVVFNNPITIVFWSDDTVTRATADGDEFSELEGLNVCYLKKKYGGWNKVPKGYSPIRVIRASM